MISKNKIKYIHALEAKKRRLEAGVFVAEGNKLVADMLPAYRCQYLLAKPSWMATQGDIPAEELVVADEEDIRRASLLKNPQDVLALFYLPAWDLKEVHPDQELVLVLDGIQDPGNLGTIIRLADWFGIQHIVCSPDTADAFNPKVVQATMGALAHVKVFYVELVPFLRDWKTQGVPLYGTFLDGENLYDKALTRNGLLVMGNEGNGVRPDVEALLDKRLYIPPFPPGRATTESLNVAIATSIVCAEFRRREGLKREV